MRALPAEIAPIPLDFDVAKGASRVPVFDAGGLDVEEPPPVLELPDEPAGLLAKIKPSSRLRYEEELAKAKEHHARAIAEHASREELRRRMLAEAMAEHERAVAEVESNAAERNREVEALQTRVESGDPSVLPSWLAAVLAASDYPDGFPRASTIAYDAGSRLLVVDYELPPLDAVPAVQSFRYDSARRAVEDVPRPPARRKDLYTVVVASVALRSVKELFDADRARVVDRIAFNGYVHGVDRVSGEPVRPHLVSFEATRDDYRTIDLARIDPIVAMRNLEAQFSTNPADLAPVKEVIGVRTLGPGAVLGGYREAGVN